MTMVSVIVPTYNEEENIQLLITRIDKAFKKHKISYEIIVVDDHSQDNTLPLLHKLEKSYPVRGYEKKGNRGKGNSLLEGFSYASSEILVMIDADLQYPPEELPQMIALLSPTVDIVVADRQKEHVSLFRRLVSTACRTLCARFLLQLSCDVQSGMKVFKKEIVERLDITPSSWTFDMEFLTKARQAGYIIASHPITFQKRHAGKAKIRIVKASWEIALSAVKVRFAKPQRIPFHANYVRKYGAGFHFKGKAYHSYTALSDHEGAFHQLLPKQKIVLAIFSLLLLVSFYWNWHATLVSIVTFLSVLYFSDLLFHLFLIFRSFSRSPEIKVSEKELQREAPRQWPLYSILCPLYKEWHVLPQFITAMEALDYPQDKLQIILLLEEDDQETISHIKHMILPSQFETIIVPHTQPKTKPKALNYGLRFARGEFVVVYDAEDRPEPTQLKKAVMSFRKLSASIVCIQAKLTYYNPTQNLLTRLFMLEYALWFDLVLTGLQSLHAPIPLGGTSNHFRLADIKRLKGWDPFNVTEDADLGIRIVKRKYRTAVLDSYTYEEANSQLYNWFRQRSRWVKGYMQTYFVHVRDIKGLTYNWRTPHPVTFQLIIGGKILSLLINPVVWLLTIIYFVSKPFTGPLIESLYLTPIFYIAIITLLFGNFLYLYYYAIGAMRRGQVELIVYTFFVPFYWLGMSLAAYYALWEFLVRPHYWQKTAHGLHLHSQESEQLYGPGSILYQTEMGVSQI